jgi:hypothetical protein
VGCKRAAGNKREKMVRKGDPSTMVNVDRRSCLTVVKVTCFLAPGHEAPFAAGIIVHADVLLVAPVGGAESDTLWQWNWRRQWQRCRAWPSSFPHQL